MYSARLGLITHLETSDVGLQQVKPYAGELKSAVKDRNILLDIMPVALVLLNEGVRARGHGEYDVELLVVSATNALQLETAAEDALLVAENLASWLESNFTWTSGGKKYHVNNGEGVGFKVMLVETDFSIVNLQFEIKEI